MMTNCWRVDPKERPTFEDILKWIQDMLMDNEVQINYGLSRLLLLRFNRQQISGYILIINFLHHFRKHT